MCYVTYKASNGDIRVSKEQVIEQLAIKLAELDGISDLAWFIKQHKLDPYTPRYRDTFLPYFKRAGRLYSWGYRIIPQLEVLGINEWLDIRGIDRAYKKEMKSAYARVKVDLQAQIAFSLRQIEGSNDRARIK